MPDITMCLSNTCPKRNSCYRKLANPDKHWQSYSDFSELCQNNNYKYYWKVENGKEAWAE